MNAPVEFTEKVAEDDHVSALFVEIREALENPERLSFSLKEQHPADVAAAISMLNGYEREQVYSSWLNGFDAEILTYLDDELRAEAIDVLGTQKTAEALATLETDDAVYVIEDLDEADQQELIEAVPEATARADLLESLTYPEESAGRLMQKRFVSVPEFWDVGQVIDYLRESEDLPEDFYEVIAVDPRYKPVGTVMISRIMQNKRDVSLRELMKQDIHPIPVEMDQEEVAASFGRYGLVEAPVVNDSGRLMGVITIDDIVTVIKEEEEEDFMRAGGILDRDLHANLLQTVRQRLPWLVLNLAAAILAAWVISQFEQTIEKMVSLAVLMPIIASLSGNAGIQSVTISVRAIATGELQKHNALPIIRKEMFTNLLNGAVLASLTAVLIYLIYGNISLAGIFAAATIGTLTLAGLIGAFVPLILSRIKIDPAIASGVFLTTLTDMLSFFSFLGLASLLLL